MVKSNFKKENLIKNLSRKTGYSLNFSKKLINDLISIIIEITKNGNLNIKNIGSFKVISKKKRIGRNPKTREEFIISARKVISFTPSQKISNKLDNINE